MKPTTPFLPKIYSLAPHMSGDISKLDQLLDRCRGMGFDHVLIPRSFDPDALSEEHARAAGPALESVAKVCAKKKLRLLIDLNIGSVERDSVLAELHPEWFVSQEGEDDLPDPRRPIRREGQAGQRRQFRYDEPEVTDEILDYVKQRLTSWMDKGVAGFRCREVAAPPSWVWGDLHAYAKTRFLAWTPGCTFAQLDALAGSGFDATFSSAAWWDYRSRWLEEEQKRLLRIAPPISFPDSPDETVIERSLGEDGALRTASYRRALRLAAATGNGILIPMGFENLRGHAAVDLSEEIVKANEFIQTDGRRFYAGPLHWLGGADGDATMLLREPAEKSARNDDALIILANADTARRKKVDEHRLLQRAHGFIPQHSVLPPRDEHIPSLTLDSSELQVYAARHLEPILSPTPRGKQAATAAARAPRIAIESITPEIDGGRFAVKRTVGDWVHAEADVFMDGHDKLAVALLWRAADEADWHEVRMQSLGNDRWAAAFPVTRMGRYLFAVEAWRDAFATYRDELEKKVGAGLNVALELEEGRLLVEAAAAYAKENEMPVADTLQNILKTLKPVRDKSKAAAKDAERVAALLSEPMLEAMRAADARPYAVRSEPPLRVEVDRVAARFASLYELFPRSQSGDPHRHGTFDDVIQRLPAIQAMGFDTLYFTPIHPIGKQFRKGRNNSLTPASDDPGSPYAIGSEEGGHDAIHPQLGTIEDFRRLRDEAARHGLEIALDFAIQCSPDHPWLKEHPEWFDWRPDGSLRYAENPPKKYQDIVNVDFYAEGAAPGLWIALRDVVLFWVKEGVRVFRVDNPHTKPLPFWEWMIADIRGRYPDVIFLSEAFTRPKMMYRLAKAGFSQSYTYFTWRHSKVEFTDYMTELTTTHVREFFRPHFFVNTPDINPYFLQRSGRPGFLIRAALAAMLSGLWGMYSGFELCEAAPIPGKEEYLDSEKYEIRVWDWERPGNIIHEITVLNRIRAQNPALQSHLGLRFLHASNDNILAFLKTTEPADVHHRLGDNVVIVVINLDPYAAHEAALDVPLWELGLPDHARFEVDDLVNDVRLALHGKRQHLRLDPFDHPYAIWRLRG